MRANPIHLPSLVHALETASRWAWPRRRASRRASRSARSSVATISGGRGGGAVCINCAQQR
eukprot:6008769-Pyramimonas_sp.AAC.1